MEYIRIEIVYILWRLKSHIGNQNIINLLPINQKWLQNGTIQSNRCQCNCGAGDDE